MVSELAEQTAEELWHFYSPADCYETFEILLGGLRAAKQDYQAARFRHDHARAGAALAEVRELTALCASMTAGMTAARRRFGSLGFPWPLMPVPELDRL